MSNEYMLIPYHLREPLLDVCMSSKLGTKEIEEIIANAPLYTAHDGEAVYQLHDGGNLWLDVSYEAFNYAPSDQARRIVHTAPPRVVDEAMVLRAAKVLADRSAKECNVDPDDNWNVYSETYIADAEQALKAAIGES